MFKVFINDVLVATMTTATPHSRLRDILIDAMLDGKKVKIVKA